jgi:hypothetical protein
MLHAACVEGNPEGNCCWKKQHVFLPSQHGLSQPAEYPPHIPQHTKCLLMLLPPSCMQLRQEVAGREQERQAQEEELRQQVCHLRVIKSRSSVTKAEGIEGMSAWILQ